GTNRTLFPILSGTRRPDADRSRTGFHAADPIFRTASGKRGGLVLVAAGAVATVPAQRSFLARRAAPARRRIGGAAAEPRPPANRARPDGRRHNRLRQGFAADLLEPAVSDPVRPARPDGPGRGVDRRISSRPCRPRRDLA